MSKYVNSQMEMSATKTANERAFEIHGRTQKQHNAILSLNKKSRR